MVRKRGVSDSSNALHDVDGSPFQRATSAIDVPLMISRHYDLVITRNTHLICMQSQILANRRYYQYHCCPVPCLSWSIATGTTCAKDMNLCGKGVCYSLNTICKVHRRRAWIFQNPMCALSDQQSMWLSDETRKQSLQACKMILTSLGNDPINAAICRKTTKSKFIPAVAHNVHEKQPVGSFSVRDVAPLCLLVGKGSIKCSSRSAQHAAQALNDLIVCFIGGEGQRRGIHSIAVALAVNAGLMLGGE